MNIDAIPLLADNYAWLLTISECRGTLGDAVVVDPGEAQPVLDVLQARGLGLSHILLTHHHGDHVGGVPELVARFPHVQVIASQHDAGRLGATHGAHDGEQLTILNAPCEVLATPGHTLGAVSYYWPKAHALFTGDTLFLAGCGRLFEGTPAMMWTSLQRLRALPAETQVYCGHEYTEKNLQFAARELGDATTQARLTHVQQERAHGIRTVPASLLVERGTNPFLRADDPAVMQKLGVQTALDAFTELRARRNQF